MVMAPRTELVLFRRELSNPPLQLINAPVNLFDCLLLLFALNLLVQHLHELEDVLGLGRDRAYSVSTTPNKIKEMIERS